MTRAVKNSMDQARPWRMEKKQLFTHENTDYMLNYVEHEFILHKKHFALMLLRIFCVNVCFRQFLLLWKAHFWERFYLCKIVAIVYNLHRKI